MNRRNWINLAAVTTAAWSCRRVPQSNSKADAATAPATIASAMKAPLNPARGFYRQRPAEQMGDLAKIRRNGMSLILLTLDLREYRDRALDDARLSILDAAMRKAREAGIKVIFRAAYGFTNNDYRADPHDLRLIQQHIAAISSVLTPHAPLLFAVQAGMLGPWGEWHGSNHGEVPSFKSRQAVLQSWLRGLPESVFLQIRRPTFLRDLKADLLRVGFHNDALFTLPDDMGTYSESGWDRAREMAWCAKHLTRVPVGGESVPGSEDTPVEQIFREMQDLHLTYLNSGYYGPTLKHWESETIDGMPFIEHVRQRMGYCLSARHGDATRSGDLLIITNDGFAAPLYPGYIELTFMQADGRPVEPIQGVPMDARSFVPGEKLAIEIIRVNSSKDEVDVFPAIRISDPSPELRNDPRYCIHLAGDNIKFIEETGWNLVRSSA